MRKQGVRFRVPLQPDTGETGIASFAVAQISGSRPG